jgi:lysophospholipid acyltransferase (LPLAT)-like uncharacterized protein
MKRLVRHAAAQAVFARLLGLYLSFALRTTRWRLEGGENLLGLAAGEPHIVAFWHERLALMPPLWRFAHRLPGARPAPGHILVSGHRDGRLVGSVMIGYGVRVVHGSTARGGAAALRRLLAVLRAGASIGITPDGPRGPRRVPAPGLAQLAALSGAPVLPCAAQTTRRWELASWDRMVIPKPFGRGVVVCGPVIRVAREGWRTALPVLGRSLTAATERADGICIA